MYSSKSCSNNERLTHYLLKNFHKLSPQNMSNIQLAPNFKIPATDYASQGNAILGIRDAGKTYTGLKAAEQLLDAGIPIIAYDPVGVWKNLKIGTGKHKGYPIVVAGGEGADIRLTPHNAVEIVRAAMKENVSLVIDLYSPELINKSTWIKIVQETVDLLMYDNKAYGLRHIFLEEAAEFIPQRLQPQHARVYASLERLARMGRNARLGMTIINQRAEEVNKAILEICAFSLVHKQVGKNSLKSIQQWLELRQLDNVKDIIKSLPGLNQGQCWAIGQTDQPKLIQVSARNTFHPDPKKGMDAVAKVPTIDVSGFVARMNKQLEKPDAKKPEPKKTASVAITAHVEEITRLRQQLAQCITENKQLKNAISSASKAMSDIAKAAQRFFEDPLPEISNTDRQISISIPKVSKSTPVVSRSAPAGNGTVASGAMRMLKAAAMYHPKPITKFRMAALAGLSYKSGSFSTYVSTLKRDGLVTVDGNEFAITAEGLDKVGDIQSLPTDPKAIVDMWCNNIGNDNGASRILRAVAECYPADVTKEDLGGMVGMSHNSGSFSTYLSTLKRNGLIEVDKGWVKASKELFQ